MSRHEGVSCDSCLKSNFRGRRYKCLICFDYDLCANCYEEGITSTRHTADHPMQCILTRLDFELYYGGEVFSPEQPQSFTCPYCKKMGFSDSGLFEHVSAEHTDTGVEVVCPVCAALPGGEPNLVTDDFAGHLNNEHRTGPRDLISFLDEPSAIRHGGVRRMPHGSHTGRALGGPRSRRSNMHFSASGGGISALSPSGREPVDPIAELLQQLSGGRRGAPQQSQLQQLQMQIQLERQQVSAARQQLERLPRRTHPVVTSTNSANGIGGSSSQQPNSVITFNANTIGTSSNPLPLAAAATSNINGALACLTGGNGLRGVIGSGLAGAGGVGGAGAVSTGLGGATGGGNEGASEAARNAQSQFLMARFMVPTLEEAELAQLERDRADRSQFVQALTISTLARHQAIDTSQEDELIADIGNLSIDVANQPVLDDQQQQQQQQQQQDSDQHYKKPPLAEDNIDDYVPSQTHHRGAGGGGGGGQQKPVNKLAGSSSAKQPAPQQRSQKPPPPSQSTKPARELKASMSSSKHVPDTR